MIRQILILVLSAITVFPLAEAQIPVEYIIWGRVVLSNGGLPNTAGIEVRLENPGHIYLTSVNTDSDGRFQFRQLNDGTFFLYINLPGFEPVYQEVRLAAPIIIAGRRSEGVTTTQPNVVLYLRRGVSDSVANNTYRDGGDGKSSPSGLPLVVNAEVFKKYPAKAVREYQDGMADTAKGNSDKAISHFGRAVELEPRFQEAMLQLGSAYIDKARSLEQGGKPGESLKAYGDAVKVLTQASQLDPSSAETNYLLGSALFKTNDFDGAESHLKQSIGAPRPYPGARLMLVNVYMKQRRYLEALDQLNAYLAETAASPERKAAEQLQSQIQRALPR